LGEVTRVIRSPRVLTPGLEELEVGQTFATIFELVEFETNSHVTLRTTGRLFGEVVCVASRRPGTGSGAGSQ
jgi:hypothetical protein